MLLKLIKSKLVKHQKYKMRQKQLRSCQGCLKLIKFYIKWLPLRFAKKLCKFPKFIHRNEPSKKRVPKQQWSSPCSYFSSRWNQLRVKSFFLQSEIKHIILNINSASTAYWIHAHMVAGICKKPSESFFPSRTLKRLGEGLHV